MKNDELYLSKITLSLKRVNLILLFFNCKNLNLFKEINNSYQKGLFLFVKVVISGEFDEIIVKTTLKVVFCFTICFISSIIVIYTIYILSILYTKYI